MTHVTETQDQILEAFTMKDYADLHTHTIASGHAYGTITEMVHAASRHHGTCPVYAGELRRDAIL